MWQSAFKHKVLFCLSGVFAFSLPFAFFPAKAQLPEQATVTPASAPVQLASPVVTPTSFSSSDEASFWKGDRQEFTTYSQFRDETIELIRSAKKRVVIVTTVFTDGDLATALLSMQVRSIPVSVILDISGLKVFSSRHGYFLNNQIPVAAARVAQFGMGGQTTLVVDNMVWRVNISLNEKLRGKVVIDKSSFTADEVLSWGSSQRSSPLRVRDFQNTAGAKTSTHSNRSSQNLSDKLEAGRDKQNQGLLPRKLPRETRLQQGQRGIRRDDPLVPIPGQKGIGITPPVSEQENELQESE